jgi:hypothetical protein
MKQHILIFSAIFLFVGVILPINAQDQIVLKDGNTIEAKVMEISPSEIRYKRFNHLDGPTIVVPISNVLSIKYENGMVEAFNTTAETGQEHIQENISPERTSILQSVLPTLVQQAINQLPAIPIAGRNLKFELGGDTWTAKANGRNFLSGTLTFMDTDEGCILTLKQTHTYVMNRMVSTPGPDITLEYIKGPPASLKRFSGSVQQQPVVSNGPAQQQLVVSNGSVQQETATSNAPGILLAANWQTTCDPNSAASVSAYRGNIDGQQQDVLALEVRLSGRAGNWAGMILRDEDIIQKLREGSGMRLKVLGDGKIWRFGLVTRETEADGNWHGVEISPERGKVVEINIPFPRLIQPGGLGLNQRVSFNKNNIIQIRLEKLYDRREVQPSTIRILGLEIY